MLQLSTIKCLEYANNEVFHPYIFMPSYYFVECNNDREKLNFIKRLLTGNR